MDHSASWSVKTLLSLVLDVARKVMALPPSSSDIKSTHNGSTSVLHGRW